jgi:hypothetical protein
MPRAPRGYGGVWRRGENDDRIQPDNLERRRDRLQSRIREGVHQVVLALSVFSEFDKNANLSFRTTGSNVYDFLTEYWVGVSVFGEDCLLRLWESYATGEGLNGS